jgi:hypothetical protein
VGCVVRLTRRLTSSRRAETLAVRVSKLPGACRLALVDKDGRVLLAQPAKAGSNALNLGKLDVPGQPLCVKLLAGTALVDVAEIPAE